MAKGKYFLNDWEALAKLRDYSDYLAKNDMGFEEAWRQLCEALPEDYDEESRAVLEKVEHTPFDALFLYLAIGRYPPPELMEMLRFIFGNYLSLKGSHDLESLFFGRPRENAGNYSSRRAKERIFAEFEGEYNSEKRLAALKGCKPLSQIAFAECFLIEKKETDRDPVNFIRSWRRWRKSPKKYF